MPWHSLNQQSGHVLLAADVRAWLRRRASLTTTPSLTVAPQEAPR
ncbi:hypothetical protein [Deinococcus ruber]|nr:hypothetical protein [Deinococcus ruber]